MSEFGDRSAVVTGGASGIGLATAHLLAARGARVAVLDRDISDAIFSAPGMHAVEADVTDDARVRAAIADSARRRSPARRRAGTHPAWITRPIRHCLPRVVHDRGALPAQSHSRQYVPMPCPMAAFMIAVTFGRHTPNSYRDHESPALRGSLSVPES